MDNASLLSLDLLTQTGWALPGRDGAITSSTVSFKPQRFQTGGIRLNSEMYVEEANERGLATYFCGDTAPIQIILKPAFSRQPERRLDILTVSWPLMAMPRSQ